MAVVELFDIEAEDQADAECRIERLVKNLGKRYEIYGVHPNEEEVG